MGNNGNGNIINLIAKPDPDKFEKYYEIPKGVFAYQVFVDQRLQTPDGIKEAFATDYVVSMAGKIMVMPANVFTQNFRKVPKTAKIGFMGFMNDKKEMEIRHQSPV